MFHSLWWIMLDGLYRYYSLSHPRSRCKQRGGEIIFSPATRLDGDRFAYVNLVRIHKEIVPLRNDFFVLSWSGDDYTDHCITFAKFFKILILLITPMNYFKQLRQNIRNQLTMRTPAGALSTYKLCSTNHVTWLETNFLSVCSHLDRSWLRRRIRVVVISLLIKYGDRE
jgi:hypothetical protein